MKKRQNRPETPDPPSQTPPSATPQQSPASHGSPQVSGGRPLNTLLNATGPKTYTSGSPTAPKVRDTPTAVASPEIKARPSCKADTATVSVAPSPGTVCCNRLWTTGGSWPGTRSGPALPRLAAARQSKDTMVNLPLSLASLQLQKKISPPKINLSIHPSRSALGAPST